MKKKSKPKLLILYAEVMGYTLSTLELLESSGVDLYVVHWDNKKISSYKIKTNRYLCIYMEITQSKKPKN